MSGEWANGRRNNGQLEVWEMNGWWMKGGREREIGWTYESTYD